MASVVMDETREGTLRSVAFSKGHSAWPAALLAGLAFAWPLLCAVLLHGPRIMIRSIGGDAYHYLTIARKALIYHIYTYDGVNVTNGFHPLWEYVIRLVFTLLRLRTHESQAVALMVMAMVAGTAGVMLSSVAILRLTNSRFLSLLVVPGLYYLVVGVHVSSNWIWWVLDGMESSFSLLFGSVFFYVLSLHTGLAAEREFNLVGACKALGLVLPFVVLSRLDDVFLLPAFLIAILLTDELLRSKVVAALWIAGPTAFCVACYLVYNQWTAGAMMPLSGGTKAGFVGVGSAFLTVAIHLAPLFDIKTLITKVPVGVALVMANGYRQVEDVYPALIAIFGALATWKYKRRSPDFVILFALCIFIPFKMGYNFLEVNLWQQDVWYFQFPLLALSVLGALVLARPWSLLGRFPIAKTGIAAVYLCLMMLAGSQYYASIVYQPEDNLSQQFWQRKDAIRTKLVSNGVTGILNYDDGITAFLLDMPSMHGFALATDKAAQKAFREGHLLSLGYARGINTLAGIGYLSTDTAPVTQAQIARYLSDPRVAKTIRADLDDFDFSLAYYDPALKMAFISFRPRAEHALRPAG